MPKGHDKVRPGEAVRAGKDQRVGVRHDAVAGAADVTGESQAVGRFDGRVGVERDGTVPTVAKPVVGGDGTPV